MMFTALLVFRSYLTQLIPLNSIVVFRMWHFVYNVKCGFFVQKTFDGTE